MKVGRVCQRMDDERAGKAMRKTRDGVPSPQEEVEWQKEAARLGFKARIAEAYAALEAILEDEERGKLQSEAEGSDFPYKLGEDWYDSSTEEGAEQNALSVCGERTAEDKAENPIAYSERDVRRFWAPQPRNSRYSRIKRRRGLGDRKEVSHLPRGAGGYGQEGKKEIRFNAFPHTCS